MKIHGALFLCFRNSIFKCKYFVFTYTLTNKVTLVVVLKRLVDFINILCQQSNLMKKLPVFFNIACFHLFFIVSSKLWRHLLWLKFIWNLANKCKTQSTHILFVFHFVWSIFVMLVYFNRPYGSYMGRWSMQTTHTTQVWASALYSDHCDIVLMSSTGKERRVCQVVTTRTTPVPACRLVRVHSLCCVIRTPPSTTTTTKVRVSNTNSFRYQSDSF